MEENTEFRNESFRLLAGDQPQDVIDSFEHITHSAFTILADRNGFSYSSSKQHDAQLLYQMTTLKCLSLLKLLEGFDYENPYDGIHFKHTTDPLSLYPIVRCQFEAYCNFNNIYIKHSGEESDILYYLWVISGLQYRGEYEPEFAANKKKHLEEKVLIVEITEKIQNTNWYINTTDRERKKIQTAIDNWNWQFVFDNGILKSKSWKELFSLADVSPEFARSIYSFLSLNTHPSNVSVFQFKDFFNTGFHYNACLHAMSISKQLMGFYISDYCRLYDTAKNKFEELPAHSQVLINLINGSFRSESHYINNLQDNF